MGTTHRMQCTNCGYAAETTARLESGCPICGQSAAAGWLHVLAVAVVRPRWIACYDPNTNTVTTSALTTSTQRDDAVQPQGS